MANRANNFNPRFKFKPKNTHAPTDSTRKKTWDKFSTLIAFGVLVVTGLVGYYTYDRMGEQNQAFLKVANQSIRPLLVTKSKDSLVIQSGLEYGFSGISNDNGQIWWEPTDSIDIRSQYYQDVTEGRLFLDNIPLTVSNIGKTPLYLMVAFSGALKSSEWTEMYHKSELLLCASIIKDTNFAYNQTDIIVLPDSVEILKPRNYRCLWQISEFEKHRELQDTLIMHPYVYIQYRDIYGRIYDYLLMLTWRMHVTIYSDNRQRQIVRGRRIDLGLMTEKTRWDILYPDSLDGKQIEIDESIPKLPQ